MRVQWAYRHALGLLFVLGVSGAVCAAGTPDITVLQTETVLEKAVRVGHINPDDAEFTPFSTRIDNQEQVHVVTALYDPEHGLAADLYYPPYVDLDAPASAGFPVLIVPQGFRAATMESYGLLTPMEQDFWIGFGAFFAMQGAVCVLYDTHDLADGFNRIMEYLDDHEDVLGLDMERLGLFGTSGHGEFVGWQVGNELVRDRLDAGIFVHGDQRGTALGHTSAAFLVIYTEDGTNFHRCGAAFAMRARMRRLNVIEINDAPYKNFFMDDETPRTAEIMTQIGEFVVQQLGTTPGYESDSWLTFQRSDQ